MGKLFKTVASFTITDLDDTDHVFTVDVSNYDAVSKALHDCANEVKGHKDSDVETMHAFDKLFKRILGPDQTDELYDIFPAGKSDWMNMVLVSNEINSAIRDTDVLDVNGYRERIASYLPEGFSQEATAEA